MSTPITLIPVRHILSQMTRFPWVAFVVSTLIAINITFGSYWTF